MNQLVWNTGIGPCDYDRDTGLYRNFGRGIYDFRVGEEVVHAGGKFRGTVASIHMGHDINGYASAGLSIIRFTDGRTCFAHVAKPANPERITFGFVVCTLSDFNGKPVGSASRFATREQAEAEVERLKAVNYPGAVTILDSDL